MLFGVVIVLGKHRSVIEYDGKLLSFWEKNQKGLNLPWNSVIVFTLICSTTKEPRREDSFSQANILGDVGMRHAIHISYKKQLKHIHMYFAVSLVKLLCKTFDCLKKGP